MMLMRLLHSIATVLIVTPSYVMAVSSTLYYSSTKARSNPQTQFLQEILMGRCYVQPPVLNDPPQACPSLIPSLIGTLNSHLDSQITPESFQSYIEAVDFTTPTDGAFFLLGAGVGKSVSDAVFVPPGLTRPEDTLGGSIMTGVVFCGIDSQTDCSFGTFDEDLKQWEGAHASFWSGAYASFASSAKGRVQMTIVLGTDGSYDEDSVDLFSSSAIPNFDDSMITRLDIYVVSSEIGGEASCDADIVMELAMSMEQMGIQYTCTEDSDWSHLFFCASSLASEKSCRQIRAMDVTDGKYLLDETKTSTESEGTTTTTTTSEIFHDANPPSESSGSVNVGVAVVTTLVWIIVFGGVIVFLGRKIGWLNDYDPLPDADPERPTQPKQ
uniref:ADP-ribosyl cyclase/cyclic ADP-ribose hydrolase n=1 Tax=Ditylum brightwellii TaxID=49249 RepID=A0A7S4VFT1_9STRA